MKTNLKSNMSGTSEGGLQELFLEELADIYSAERTLTKALPKMARAADSDELKDAIRSHLEETENHVSRLEEVFNSLDARVKSKRCEGIEGILEEGEELMEDAEGSSALDAALISAAQKVEHYEIAGYGTVRTYAQLLGRNEWVQLLEQTLQEEKDTDVKLSQLSNHINVEARAA